MIELRASHSRLRELFVQACHEPLAQIPDVAEAIETEALGIIDGLEEQLEARTLERDAHFQRANEAEARERELGDVLAASKEISRWALENKRCDEPSPQSDMLCDREPGHEGPHVNWQAVEWSQASSPASSPHTDDGRCSCGACLEEDESTHGFGPDPFPAKEPS